MRVRERYNQLLSQYGNSKQLLQPDRLLKRAAETWPDRDAIICGDDRITYRELYQRAIRISTALKTRDIGPRSHVLLMYENSITFFACYFGIWQTGAVVAPLNTYLHEDELHHIIKDFEPSAIVTSQTYKEKFQSAKTKAPLFLHEDLVQEDQNIPEHIEIPDRNADEPAAVLYTSGTTGYPKGVMLSSKNIITNTIQGIALFDIQEHERVYAALPLFHSFMQNAGIWSPFMIGATTIVIPRISRSNLIKGFSHKPTFLPTIPQLYGLLCRLRDVSLETVKLCISGGDALADTIRMAVAMRFRRRICNGYGLTETSPFVSVNLDDTAEPASIVGHSVPGVEVDIRGQDGSHLPAGEVGVLWVRGDNVMLGYHNAPQETQAVLQNGWFKTGDLACITHNNKIMLCGRAKDVIIHKGRNIYPQEIENVLMTHPDVNMAGVVGTEKNNEEWPVAFVATGASPDKHSNLDQELRELCRDHLAQYKIPIRFHVKKSLPTTTTGKVDKKELRKEL